MKNEEEVKPISSTEQGALKESEADLLRREAKEALAKLRKHKEAQAQMPQ